MNGKQDNHNHNHEHVTEQTSLLSTSNNKTSKSKDSHECHDHDVNSHSHSHSHGHTNAHERQLFEHDKDTAASSSLPPKPTNNDPVLQRLTLATVLCCTFMTVEIVGGLWAGSLAVLSDAAHLLADLASFAVAIVAAYLAARPSTEFHTYGLKRTESLAALFSMTTLALISIGLAAEAVRRIYHMILKDDSTTSKEDVDGKLMSLIATIGVLVNVALAGVLGSEGHVHMPGAGGHDHSHDHDHGDHHSSGGGGHDHGGHDHTDNHDKHDNEHDEETAHLMHPSSPSSLHADEVVPATTPEQQATPTTKNVNLQAAYLHVMADLAQSIAVLMAGLIIWWKPSWNIVDPIATILFCMLVFYSTLSVIRSAVAVMLEEVPPSVSWQTVLRDIQAISAVTDVHDLHIWSISQGVNALSVHVHAVTQEDRTNDNLTCAIHMHRIMTEIALVAKRNGIRHTTIQVQPIIHDNPHSQQCITCGMSDRLNSCV